jgi:hypothetical protein
MTEKQEKPKTIMTITVRHNTQSATIPVEEGEKLSSIAIAMSARLRLPETFVITNAYGDRVSVDSAVQDGQIYTFEKASPVKGL